ncbi:malolactic enzyme [Eggerthia catenaformis]|uniref:malolactic enzyme n=1 Tax=Eggerthia catenaformis TaxID=31973 RepID=UPI003C6F67FB
MKKGYALLNDPFLNKGTAFTKEEREQLGLVGLIPDRIQTIEQQTKQAYENFQKKVDNVEKRHYLMEIFGRNRTLFYKLFSQHVEEFMPIVYDPVVADAIENYSHYFVEPQNAAFISIHQKDNIETILKQAADGRDIELIVVSDAEAILGIGDWGLNGVGISVGKLMVYTAAAGINPTKILPVVLDAGTNRQSLLDDPLYLGNPQKRIYGDDYYNFVDKFVNAAESLFPNLYLHFEDFGRGNAANILDKYKDMYAVFNDDIEGTGIITLAGILGGLNISKEKLSDQIYLCFGAGTAGAGIADRVFKEFVQQGMSEEEARKHFYLVDKQGLLFDDMDDLTPQQRPFARKRSEFDNADKLVDLLDIVKTVKPTIMVGTSTEPHTFTEQVVKEMASYCKRPMIFPLSNPTELAEATAEDLIKWTNGRALVATGIPSADVEYNGVKYEIGQANNALIYPGLGLGVIATRAKFLSEEMISKAAHSLGGIVDTNRLGAAVLPPVSKLTMFSETVAIGVANEAIAQNLSREPISDVKQRIQSIKWCPEYKSLI